MVVCGNCYYLVDMSSNRGYSFSEYGEEISPVNARYVLSLGGSVREVDILSILSDGAVNESELYLRGEKLLVKGSGMQIFSKISKSVSRVSFITYRVVGKEENGTKGLVQILIPLNKNKCSMKDLKMLLGI